MVQTDVKTEAKTEEIREPLEPLEMKKRAGLMEMETEEMDRGVVRLFVRWSYPLDKQNIRREFESHQVFAFFLSTREREKKAR